MADQPRQCQFSKQINLPSVFQCQEIGSDSHLPSVLRNGQGSHNNATAQTYSKQASPFVGTNTEHNHKSSPINTSYFIWTLFVLLICFYYINNNNCVIFFTLLRHLENLIFFESVVSTMSYFEPVKAIRIGYMNRRMCVSASYGVLGKHCSSGPMPEISQSSLFQRALCNMVLWALPVCAY